MVDNPFVENLVNKRILSCHKCIAKATSFIARARNICPTSGQSRLFEAHMMSHTARAAVRRCKELSHLNEIERVSRDSLKSYSDSLKIASSHFQSKSFIYRTVLTTLGIVITIIVFFIRWLIQS